MRRTALPIAIFVGLGFIEAGVLANGHVHVSFLALNGLFVNDLTPPWADAGSVRIIQNSFAALEVAEFAFEVEDFLGEADVFWGIAVGGLVDDGALTGDG